MHRDLKPSNILIDRHGQPQITDFGLAKRIDHDSNLTVTGQIIGTPNFMPPEQAAGRREAVGPHSDIYSMGAVLYFLLTGRPPFEAGTTHETLVKVMKAEAAPPRRLRPGAPKDLEVICLKCLEKKAERRYATAKALAEDLGRFLHNEPIQAQAIGPGGRLWRAALRRRATTLATAAALILISTAAVMLYSNRGLVALIESLRPAPHEMPTRSAGGVSGVIDGKIYITSPGIGVGDVYSKLFHVYDPRANSWTRLADTLVSHDSGAAGAISGKLYLVGGNVDGTNLHSKVLEVYDPAIDAWKRGTPMPTGRVNCAGAVWDGSLYVIGGHDGSNYLATVESYDPASDSWRVETPLHIPRGGCGAVEADGMLCVLGGTTNDDGATTDTIETRTRNGAWVVRAER